jgi:hypothetical protein
MTETTRLQCSCGRCRLGVERSPIVSVECCCTSCRIAGGRLETLPGAPRIVQPNGATHFVLYRKDRVHFVQGAELLREYRLTSRSPTRRVVASCCNTPMFLDFTRGHWLSLYGCLWTAATVPPVEMRTMASDAPDGAALSDDVPNPRRHAFRFFVRLLGAWVAMRFKVPKIAVNGELHI